TKSGCLSSNYAHFNTEPARITKIYFHPVTPRGENPFPHISRELISHFSRFAETAWNCQETSAPEHNYMKFFNYLFFFAFRKQL
ncbi:MAG: hypothetical protein WBD61_06140, partial [Desulfobulbales bacterium]